MDEQTLQNALSQWIGSLISINKHELHDVDSILMKLGKIELENRQATIDGYLGEHLLRLTGDGRISTGAKMEKLPNDHYEIPLEGVENIEVGENNISFESSRGAYTIHRQ